MHNVDGKIYVKILVSESVEILVTVCFMFKNFNLVVTAFGKSVGYRGGK